jgi:hypothetical protein
MSRRHRCSEGTFRPRRPRILIQFGNLEGQARRTGGLEGQGSEKRGDTVVERGRKLEGGRW